MRHLFELSPILLALIASVVCSLRYQRDRRKHDRAAMILATVACVTLLIAQSSWWASTAAGNLVGTDFSNILWTIFNNLVMLTFILIAWPRSFK